MLIALAGHAFVGKDTVADHLVSRHGFVKGVFSDAVHDALLRLDPLVPALDVEGNVCGELSVRYSSFCAQRSYSEAKKRPEVRALLQRMGTEVGREYLGEDLWVDIMARKVRAARHAGKRNFVVTGLRFYNELVFATNHGVAVWVVRPGYGPVNSHVSDSALSESDFEYVLHNDGSLADLCAKVDHWMDCPSDPKRVWL